MVWNLYIFVSIKLFEGYVKATECFRVERNNYTHVEVWAEHCAKMTAAQAELRALVGSRVAEACRFRACQDVVRHEPGSSVDRVEFCTPAVEQTK
jgi:hypothetical protein